MVDKRVRDMAAASELGGTELFYADDGSSDVKVTANQISTFTNTHAPFSTNVWVDIRDFGDISSGTITTALQATLDSFGASASLKFINILIPDIGIVLTCGAITFPAVSYTIGIACRKLIFTSTLTPPFGTKIVGLTTRQSAAVGAVGSIGTHLLMKCDPGILVNFSNITLENLVVEADGAGGGVGVKIFKADTCMIKHCSFGGLFGAAKEALIVDELFWLDVQDCTFTADDGTPAILIGATAVGAVTGSGLIRFQNICITDGCVRLRAETGSATTEGIYFDFLQHENMDTGKSIIELDSSLVQISDCIFKNVLGADSAANSYTIKNTGSNTRGIRVQCEDFAMDPTSTPIEDFEVITQAGVNSGDVTPSTAADHNVFFGYSWPSAIDKHNVASPRGTAWTIGTVANVNQDGTTWANESGSPVVASGQRAPDGTTNAFKITGAGGGDARRLFGPSSALGTFAAGDWLIAGCWIKSNSDADTSGSGAYIDFNDFGGTMANFPAGQVTLGRIWGHGSVRHDGWVWFSAGVKCITASSSLPNGPDLKLIASVGTTTKFYFNPCLQKVPVSLGLSDMDVANYIRSLSCGWPPQATLSGAGQVSVLDHQMVRAGGFGLKDGVTAPSTISGIAQIYVDTADGDLKVIFGDGVIKTIVLDT